LVQVVDNLTDLTGVVLARSPHPTLPGWDVVRLSVERATPVTGKADLLSRHVGSELDVAVRRELLGTAGPSSRLSCRSKFTFDGALCEPHPAPGAFRIASSDSP
jgi:hypothetical protein